MVTSLSNASKDRLAKAQSASGTQFFGNGFSDNVNEYVLDPTYEPTHDDEETDSPNEGWAFSMFEGEVAKAADGESSESEDKSRWWARNKRHLTFSMTQIC